MKIAAYIRPRGMITPTGVGKHQLNMLAALSTRRDVEVCLLAPEDELVHGGLPAGSPLAHLPLRVLPFPRKLLEWSWVLLGRPYLDQWCNDADWFYAPMEVFLPNRRGKAAATVHCVGWFEQELPWYTNQDTRRQRRRFRPVLWRVLRDADRILTVSIFLKTRIVNLFGGDPKRIAVVGNGVEDEFFHLPASIDRPLNVDSSYLLVIAALEARKGAQYVLSLARALLTAEPATQVIIAGGACGYEEFLAQAVALPNVKLLPFQTAEKIRSLLRDAVALLVLSRYETFGIPILEAMATGTPVIAAHFAALPEIVCQAGIIVDPLDCDATIDAIRRLRRDPGARRSLIDAGFQRASEFTWERCAQKLVSALQSSDSGCDGD